MVYRLFFAVSRTFSISIATVIIPTPPGTGVMFAIPAISSAIQSPQSFPFSFRLMPTSITRAFSRIMSFCTSQTTQAATTTISAFFVCEARFLVCLLQTVTVAPRLERRMERGFPTRFPCPTIVMFDPAIVENRSIIRIIPLGVQGIHPILFWSCVP